MDDDIAAALDGIRENFAMRSKHAQGLGANPADFRRLLKAVEDALKLADDLDAEAVRFLATAARLRTGATGTQNRAWAHRDCAEAIRVAITAALTGQDAGVTRG